MAWLRATTTLAVLLTVMGCQRRASPPVTPDPARAAPVSRAMLGGGGVEISGRDAFDRLFESPEITAAGERLLQRLGADPSLEPLYTGFIESLLGQPALLQALLTLADQDPDASVESLSAEVGERLSEAIDGPVFDAALDASIDRLLDRPDVDAAFERMTESLIEDGGFTDKLSELLVQWQPDLEDVVGVPMTDERFEERFDAHLAQPGRAAALEDLLAERIAGDPGIRAALADLLDDEAVFTACAALVTDLLTSEGFAEGATEVFAGMIVEVDAEELGRRVDAVLVNPGTEKAVVDWVDRVMEAPSFGAIGVRLGALLDDPNVQAELYGVLLGTPKGSAA